MSSPHAPSEVLTAQLMSRAREVAERAYSPYSKARVGCALMTSGGVIYTGCNVENASYGLTLCAERVAVGAAVTGEGPGMQWTQLAVVALGLEFPPCGACRQVLQEFAVPGARISFLSGGRPLTLTMEELLPAGFDRTALGSSGG